MTIYDIYIFIKQNGVDYLNYCNSYSNLLMSYKNEELLYFSIWELFPWLTYRYDNYVNNLFLFDTCSYIINELCNDYIEYNEDYDDDMYGFTIPNLLHMYNVLYMELLITYDLKKELKNHIITLYTINIQLSKQFYLDIKNY